MSDTTRQQGYFHSEKFVVAAAGSFSRRAAAFGGLSAQLNAASFVAHCPLGMSSFASVREIFGLALAEAVFRQEFTRWTHTNQKDLRCSASFRLLISWRRFEVSRTCFDYTYDQTKVSLNMIKCEDIKYRRTLLLFQFLILKRKIQCDELSLRICLVHSEDGQPPIYSMLSQFDLFVRQLLWRRLCQTRSLQKEVDFGPREQRGSRPCTSQRRRAISRSSRSWCARGGLRNIHRAVLLTGWGWGVW